MLKKYENSTLWFLQVYFLFKRFCDLCALYVRLRFYRRQYKSNHRKFARAENPLRGPQSSQIILTLMQLVQMACWLEWILFYLSQNQENQFDFYVFFAIFFLSSHIICMWKPFTFNIHGEIKKPNVYYRSNLHF